ncbi:MAG: replicative helicase, partial [Actinomycetota bacterium]|nr:replicative helicase [Actinomycetota bacterium]
MSHYRRLDVALAHVAESAETTTAATDRYPTGFRPLDGYLGDGLRPGELTLVAGRQGVGKTTFVMQACRHVAASGIPVVLASFEHNEQAIVER